MQISDILKNVIHYLCFLSRKMGNWKRPESVGIPTVWRRFEGRTPLGKNGKIPTFKIQDFTEDLRETVKTHMATYFLRDEPMCQNKGIAWIYRFHVLMASKNNYNFFFPFNRCNT